MRWIINDSKDRLLEARDAVAKGELVSARALYEELALDTTCRVESLEQLVLIALQTGAPKTAEEHLHTLVDNYPDQAIYRKRLATLLEQQHRFDEALGCYEHILQLAPLDSVVRFNMARLLQRTGSPEAALEQYRECLRGGIERPEEVHNSRGIILGQLNRHEESRRCFETAIVANKSYVPAIFNLGVLEEEHGRWGQASALFQRILTVDPRHPGAMVRLANGMRIDDASDPLIRRLKRTLRSSQVRGVDREELLYALGKVADDCADYPQAFSWYQQANAESRQRAGSYHAEQYEQQVTALTEHCDTDWLRSIAPVSERPHVFICGMFRSGSTLVEQVLGAHPALTAGGELDFFQRQLERWPEDLWETGSADLQTLALDYDKLLDQQFGLAARTTNKRPDNFLLLGLLAALYPNALFIETQRHPLDNCLSLFFQPFGRKQTYTNDLLDCGHYYVQYKRLMAHWRELLGARLKVVSYEGLVAEPEPNMRELTDFLSLPWDAACLRFHEQESRVRTASVHQVRQPLYAHSDGRWRNYRPSLEPLSHYLSQQQALAPYIGT